MSPTSPLSPRPGLSPCFSGVNRCLHLTNSAVLAVQRAGRVHLYWYTLLFSVGTSNPTTQLYRHRGTNIWPMRRSAPRNLSAALFGFFFLRATRNAIPKTTVRGGPFEQGHPSRTVRTAGETAAPGCLRRRETLPEDPSFTSRGAVVHRRAFVLTVLVY